MTIRRRLATALGAVTLVFALLAAGLAGLASWAGFSTVESGEADRDAERTAHAVDREAQQLSQLAEDWSFWDDTLAYVRGGDPGYESANLIAETFEILQLSQLVIADAAGRVLWAAGLEDTGALVPADPALVDAVRPGRALHTPDLDSATVGIREVAGGLVLVASQPISDSSGDAPVGGTFVMARDLDDAFLGVLSGVVQRELTLEPLDTTLPGRERTGTATISRVPLQDGEGTHLATLAVSTPRVVAAVGRRSVLAMTAVIVVALLAMGATALALVDRIVVRRLLRLRTDSATIQRAGTGRVHDDGADDELAEVTRAVNRMLASLDRSRQDLEIRNNELTELAQFRQDLVSVLSHELRTPLTTIGGFAAMLNHSADDLESTQRAHMLSRIEVNAQHLSRLIGDLLVLSRADDSEITVEPHVVDLGAMLTDVGLDLRVHLVSAIPAGTRVHCDSDHLRLMLSDLIENADKYGEAPIEVRAASIGDTVRITVSDRGPGIPADFAPRMFDRFTQASTGNQRTATGVGLGLAVVQMLATVNGGRVHHDAAQEGATMVLVLPAAPRVPRASRPDLVVEEVRSGTRRPIDEGMVDGATTSATLMVGPPPRRRPCSSASSPSVT